MLVNMEIEQEWRGGFFLTRCESSFEADLLESKLNSEGIPTMKKYLAGGNFIEIAMGSNSIFPIDIYVPEQCLEDAKNIIKPVPLDDDFEEEQQ